MEESMLHLRNQELPRCLEPKESEVVSTDGGGRQGGWGMQGLGGFIKRRGHRP